MSNSSLVTYKNTNHKHYSKVSSRKIDKIIIHHAAAIWKNAQAGCDYFATTKRQVSSTYCIGNDGSVGLSVDESYRPWTTGSLKADGNAVTIETSNSAIGEATSGKGWTVGDKALKTLIKLCADIANRNGLGKLVVGKNLSAHRDWASTACPGDYLYSKLSYICEEANKINYPTQVAKKTGTQVLYRVQCGAFASKTNATNYALKIKAKGISTIVIQDNGYYKVQCGAFSSKTNAQTYAKRIENLGFKTVIVEVKSS